MFLSFLTGSLFTTPMSAQLFSESGYPEHFAAGMIIGGAVSYLTFKKTDNKFKAWAFGTAASASIGLLKELADPLFNHDRNLRDLQYTTLGGIVGASVVIPLRRRREKPVK